MKSVVKICEAPDCENETNNRVYCSYRCSYKYAKTGKGKGSVWYEPKRAPSKRWVAAYYSHSGRKRIGYYPTKEEARFEIDRYVVEEKEFALPF